MPRARSAGLTFPAIAAKLTAVITPALPLISGTLGGWLFLGLKILGALGFMAAANVVILYAS